MRTLSVKHFLLLKNESSYLRNAAVLQTAVGSVNDSLKRDGLVSTIFGAMPPLELTYDRPSHSSFESIFALQNATTQMSNFVATRQIRDAPNALIGPGVTKTN